MGGPTSVRNFEGLSQLRLPPPEKYNGTVELWEDWSWNFISYMSMHYLEADDLMNRILRSVEEGTDTPITDADLARASEPAADTLARKEFSRKRHYMLCMVTTDSARLVIKQAESTNGLETWRRLAKQFQLPGATRHVGLLTRILEPTFNESTFESDFQKFEVFQGAI